MSEKERIRRHIVQEFGEAYRAFGLNRLMGHIVALLLFSPTPLSLDDIAKQLRKSKGPVSQITRRLRDKNIIRKVWVPGSRKDYYDIDPDSFEHAFRNNLALIRNNHRIARDIASDLKRNSDPTLDTFRQRVDEMERFYALMDTHFQRFLDDWRADSAVLKTNERVLGA